MDGWLVVKGEKIFTSTKSNTRTTITVEPWKKKRLAPTEERRLYGSKWFWSGMQAEVEEDVVMTTQLDSDNRDEAHIKDSSAASMRRITMPTGLAPPKQKKRSDAKSESMEGKPGPDGIKLVDAGGERACGFRSLGSWPEEYEHN